MEYAIYIVVIVLQLAIAVYFIMRNRKLKREAMLEAAKPAPDSYEGLRERALSVTPANLKLGIPDSETFVYGVVMDWNMGDTQVTLSTFITGAANMYLSTGSGVVGGGKNPSVGEAASELVTMAQNFVSRAMPVVTHEIPAKDCVRFFLLTNHQVHAAQEQVIHFDDGTSPWLPMFEKANEVIIEMRAVLN